MNLTESLTKKLGPLPVWAWAGIGAGGAWWYLHKKGSTTTAAQTAAATANPLPIQDLGLGGGGIGVSGADTSSPSPQVHHQHHHIPNLNGPTGGYRGPGGPTGPTITTPTITTPLTPPAAPTPTVGGISVGAPRDVGNGVTIAPIFGLGGPAYAVPSLGGEVFAAGPAHDYLEALTATMAAPGAAMGQMGAAGLSNALPAAGRVQAPVTR